MSGPVHAEWTKLRTSPETPWLLLSLIVATVLVSLGTVASAHCPSGGCVADPAKLSLVGVQLGQAVVAVLAVLGVGTEYSSGMIRTSLLAMPRRIGFLAAKAAALLPVLLLAAAIAVLGCLLAGGAVLPGHGFTPEHGYLRMSAPSPTLLRAGIGSVLYLGLIALLSLGVAAAVRDSAAAIGVVLGLLYLAPILIEAVGDPGWQRHLRQLAPSTAGLAVQASTGGVAEPIGPWAGLGVLACWTAAALLAGALALRLRDA